MAEPRWSTYFSQRILPEIAFLNDTHVPESEGQHLQQVWPTFADRNERHCAPFLKSLCLLNFTSLLAKDNSAI